MSANCGLYVPSKAELFREGVERRNVHPNLERYDDLEEPAGLLEALRSPDRIGRKIQLPDSTPKTFPPFQFATRQWSDRSWRTVHRIQRKAPGIVCATYQGHGRTGEPWGIDAFVSKMHEKANAAEEEAGDRLVEWAVRNWEWLNLNYVIWWNYMHDGAGWFWYEPWRKTGSGARNSLRAVITIMLISR